MVESRDQERPRTPPNLLKVEDKVDDPNENSYARQMERMRNVKIEDTPAAVQDEAEIRRIEEEYQKK